MKSNSIKADLHIHTHFSFDSLAVPENVLKAAVKRGLNAIAITDHNELAGALEAAAIAKQQRLPVQVIIGEEVATDKGDLLVYFVKKKILPGTLERVLSDVKKQGAVSCAAHPYDKVRHGIQLEALEPRLLANIDAIEAFNSRVTLPSHNVRALRFAQKHGKAVLAGSDAHHPLEVGSAAVEFIGVKKLDKRSVILSSREVKAKLSSPLVHFLSRYAVLKKRLRRKKENILK